MAEGNNPRDATYFVPLFHGDKVRAVAIASPTNRVFTGGKRCVKVWDIAAEEPTTEFGDTGVLCRIRSMKISPDQHTLVVGRDSNEVSIWDIAGASPQRMGGVSLGASYCRDLAISSDSKLCFSCDLDGEISMWDLHNRALIHQFHVHIGGAHCFDVTNDGTTLWTGSMNSMLRSWDLRNYAYTSWQGFPSPILLLRCSTIGNLLAVGLTDCRMDIIDYQGQRMYRHQIHRMAVRSLKFAHSGKWYVSTGDDRNLIGSTAPAEAVLFNKRNNAAVTCCDISSDDAIIVTGSSDHGKVYRVEY